MSAAAPTMDTLGPFFYPLLEGAELVAQPILGSYNRVIGYSNTSLCNAVLALSIALALRSCRRVHASIAASKSSHSSKVIANGSAKAKGKSKQVSHEPDNGEVEVNSALSTLHFAFLVILGLAATRSLPLRGDEGDGSRSLAIVAALAITIHQALQWTLDDEPAPVALAATTHCLGFTLALFPLGGAARHLKHAAALATHDASTLSDGANVFGKRDSLLLPPYTGLYAGRALLVAAGFLLVVALTAIGLSLGRWEQFRRLEYQIATGILAADFAILALLEFS